MDIEKKFNEKIHNALNQWQFNEACKYHDELLQHSFKHISEYLKLLADFGKLDTIYDVFSKHGFSLVEKQQQDPQQKHPGVIGYCSRFIKDTYLPSKFDCISLDKNVKLLHLSQKNDKSELSTYFEKNSAVIINNNSVAEDNMILNFAINKLLSAKLMEGDLGIKIAYVFTTNANINPLRKRFVISSMLNYFYTKEDHNFFKLKDVAYNHLQRISAQLSSFFHEEGAKKFYSKLNNIILSSNNVRVKTNENKKPRVAVCVSGMFRGNESAIQTIQENIISPLNADVFIHSWDSWQPWPGMCGALDNNWMVRLFGYDSSKICPDELKSFSVFKKYFPRSADVLDTQITEPFTPELLSSFIQPISFRLDSEADFITSLGNHADAFISRGKHNQAKMFYGIYEVTQLMVTHEKENNFEYDYVIRIRPDCAVVGKLSWDFLNKLNVDELATGNGMAFDVGPSDIFNISKRDVHIKVANLWAASLTARQLSPFEGFVKYDAHALLFLWMLKNHIIPITPSVKIKLNLVTSSSLRATNFHDAFIHDLHHTAKKFEQDDSAKKFIDFMSGL